MSYAYISHGLKWKNKMYKLKRSVMAHALHYNRVKFPKDLFSIFLCTNMAAVTSGEKPSIGESSLIGLSLLPSSHFNFFFRAPIF